MNSKNSLIETQETTKKYYYLVFDSPYYLVKCTDKTTGKSTVVWRGFSPYEANNKYKEALRNNS